MSAMTDRLKLARGMVAWTDLIPAFDLAIVQAEQAEYEADRAMNLAQCGTSPAYPPLVVKLAESAPEPPVANPWADIEVPDAPKAPWDVEP